MSTISVMKYIPQTPEGYTYDDDGNLAQDARWEYTWDGENRLVAMQTKAGLTPKLAKRRLEFTYDYMGRRALKKVYEVRDEQTFTSTLISTTKFLYDDWNLIAELDKNNTVKRSYTWGTDISRSMQGAGGVGGLLWMEDHGTSKTYFYLYDGNGNVTSLVDADTGEQVADYDYGPFGEPVKNVSSIEQPFRFSTKYRDKETKLYYYGYRYYNSDTGRWLNRDPIEERGGKNLYAIDGNNFVNGWDYLGHGVYTIGSPVEPRIVWDDDFPFGSKRGQATSKDRWNYNKWGSFLFLAMFFKDMPDAISTYTHFRAKTGADYPINYEKAYKKDRNIRKQVDKEIRSAMLAAEKLYATGGSRFSMTGTNVGTGKGEYPATENWQKAIGGHQIWGSANVVYDGCEYFRMTITIHEIDKYNFNRGQNDIASGTSDNVNGRFEELGWARSFITKGTLKRTLRWKKGDVSATGSIKKYLVNNGSGSGR